MEALSGVRKVKDFKMPNTETMLDIMYELPSQKDVEEVVISEEVVAKGEKHMMVYAKKKQAS